MVEICVIGGGPGGLLTAWNIRRKLGSAAKIVLFEAAGRLGGKILTERFGTDGPLYEAGVAEIYDYSEFGHDPFRSLVEDTLGLATVPMDSSAIALDGHLLDGLDGVRRHFGDATADAILRFRDRCAELMSPQQYYERSGTDDNAHPWARISLDEVLEREIADPVARRFIKVASRSDIASEPHLTNGLNGLKNVLMDVDGYIGLYSVVGGNGRIVERLAAQVDADIRLEHRVRSVGRTPDGRYRVVVQHGFESTSHAFDAVVVALPHNWLSTVAFEGEALRRAMVRHVAHFDRPGHYLRVTCLFEDPFWRAHLTGAWFMSDAFGGCCIYDEGARHDGGGSGILNWLVAGSDVLAWGNLDRDALVEEALRTLPVALRAEAPAKLRDARVHRWLSSVNAIPGGVPVRKARVDHLPEPREHPGLFLVGDYLFDSTLNGLFDSSDAATDFLLSHLMMSRYHSGEARRDLAGRSGVELPAPSGTVDRTYHRRYRGLGPYEAVWQRFAEPDAMLAQIERVWGLRRPFRLLVVGSASGQLVEALRERGVDAWGVENNRAAHGGTPDAVRPFNILGSVLDLPFGDAAFDVVWETCLCHVGRSRVRDAIDELHRVAGTGAVLASVTSDLGTDAIDRYDLLRGVRTLTTWWEWSDRMLEAGFVLALDDPERLAAAWAAAPSGPAPARWLKDEESFRHCFFSRPAPVDIGRADADNRPADRTAA